MKLATQFVAAGALAFADGGAMVLQHASGNLLVAVFAAPQPLLAGPIDISVLVEKRDAEEPVLDADVKLDIRGRLVRMTQDQAANKLLQGARIEIPESGQFPLRVFVSYRGEETVCDGSLQIAPAHSRLGAIWPTLLIPPAAIALFFLKQRLRRAGSARIPRTHAA